VNDYRCFWRTLRLAYSGASLEVPVTVSTGSLACVCSSGGWVTLLFLLAYLLGFSAVTLYSGCSLMLACGSCSLCKWWAGFTVLCMLVPSLLSHTEDFLGLSEPQE
jgi:hypothetical protein